MAQFPSTTAADGIWTLKKVRRAILGDNWPPLVFTDDFFKNTVLLLQADDVTDGSQNNTFLDASTNTHTITRNGNVTQGSFSPFSQDEGKWGNYFENGETNTLSIADNTALDIYDGDYTVEFWVYITEFSSTLNTIISKGTDASAREWAFTIKSTDTGVYVSANGSVNSGFSVTTTNNTHEWIHFAYVRSGSTITVYKNGLSIGSGTYASTSYKGSGKAYIGRFVTYNNINHGHKGYISNLRIVKGSAVYSSAFTPSTTPLTDITNTTLLTCQSNRFVDNSSQSLSVDVETGTPEVTPFSPFAPSTVYDPATKGGSGYFDGSGDYLDGPSTNTVTNFGTGDFTVEFWFYTNTTASQQNLLDNIGNSSYAIYIPAGGASIRYYVGGDVITGGAISSNTWHHVALVRSSSSTKLYLNGTQTGSTYSDSNNYAGANNFPRIGGAFNGTVPINGYMSDVRIVKGTAVYTSDFTPPTAPLSTVSGTELLCNFTNAGIYDGTGRNVLETVGNAQVDTAVVKYGTGSMQFDGTGDYLEVQDSPTLDIRSGDFTIEGWIYPTATVSVSSIIGTFTTAGSNNAVHVLIGNDSGQVAFYWGAFSAGSSLLSGGSAPNDTWTHLAVVRSGNTFTLYVNGTSVDSTTNTSAPLVGTTNEIEVGARNGGQNGLFIGFMDDLRITKGVARYTANFTPPAAKLEQQ